MSSEICDCGSKLESIYRRIWDFLYEDGKPLLKGGKPGVIRKHTEEEYIEDLKGLPIEDIKIIAEKLKEKKE